MDPHGLRVPNWRVCFAPVAAGWKVANGCQNLACAPPTCAHCRTRQTFEVTRPRVWNALCACSSSCNRDFARQTSSHDRLYCRTECHRTECLRKACLRKACLRRVCLRKACLRRPCLRRAFPRKMACHLSRHTMSTEAAVRLYLALDKRPSWQQLRQNRVSHRRLQRNSGTLSRC